MLCSRSQDLKWDHSSASRRHSGLFYTLSSGLHCDLYSWAPTTLAWRVPSTIKIFLKMILYGCIGIKTNKISTGLIILFIFFLMILKETKIKTFHAPSVSPGPQRSACCPTSSGPSLASSLTLHRHTAATFQSAFTAVEGEIILKKEI